MCSVLNSRPSNNLRTPDAAIKAGKCIPVCCGMSTFPTHLYTLYSRPAGGGINLLRSPREEYAGLPQVAWWKYHKTLQWSFFKNFFYHILAQLAVFTWPELSPTQPLFLRIFIPHFVNRFINLWMTIDLIFYLASVVHKVVLVWHISP